VTPVEPYFCISMLVPSTTYGTRCVLRPALCRFVAFLFHVRGRDEGEDRRDRRAYVLLVVPCCLAPSNGALRCFSL
jgi:hypothetical protein